MSLDEVRELYEAQMAAIIGPIITAKDASQAAQDYGIPIIALIEDILEELSGEGDFTKEEDEETTTIVVINRAVCSVDPKLCAKSSVPPLRPEATYKVKKKRITTVDTILSIPAASSNRLDKKVGMVTAFSFLLYALSRGATMYQLA